MPAVPSTHVRLWGVPLTRPVARAYFCAQAACGIVWWILVASVPEMRDLTLGSLPALPVAVADLPLFVGASACGALAMIAASALGLWSGATMALPLPSATARKLVIAGPYRYVRNPMAVPGRAWRG